MTGDYILVDDVRQYDVAPDGDRFLVLESSGNRVTADTIVIVENWFEELKRLVPATD